MSRTTPWFLMLLAGALVSAPACADDDDAALMKACPGLAAWAASHPHRSDEAAQHDAGRRAAMNLMPLSVYRCVLRVSYAPPAKGAD